MIEDDAVGVVAQGAVALADLAAVDADDDQDHDDQQRDGRHRAAHADRLVLGRGASPRPRGPAPASGRASSTSRRPPLSLRLRRLDTRLINFVEERQAWSLPPPEAWGPQYDRMARK